MYYLISVLAGIIIAGMIAINGNLTAVYGVYSATLIIHIVGLVFVWALIFIKRKRIKPDMPLPWYLYTGGMVGVFTTVFNNLAFGKISVSAILALGLLGQSMTSLVFDQVGFLGMQKHVFKKSKLIGIAFVMAGILFMTLPIASAMVVPIIVSLITGFTIVASRTINARLTAHTSVLVSTGYNFVTGIVVAAMFLLLLGGAEPMRAGFVLQPQAWLYVGGMLGVVVIMLLSASVAHISSFYMTLLLFVGQVLAGIVIDAVLTGAFDVKILIGGVLVAAGLAINVLLDRRQNNAKERVKT